MDRLQTDRPRKRKLVAASEQCDEDDAVEIWKGKDRKPFRLTLKPNVPTVSDPLTVVQSNCFESAVPCPLVVRRTVDLDESWELGPCHSNTASEKWQQFVETEYSESLTAAFSAFNEWQHG